ncbi:methanogenic corrinoid protein MtbC1 [Nakamurella sp. UYEF19]|uniref:MerR family transcriptional regulator n=1 Tax=Nakamurella sp. UYEF19 TaxID=1756392 RepID=UPI00339B5850
MATTPIDEVPGRREPTANGVPIAELSAVLGVPMPTLRSWELRYGIPTMNRTSGRHRRYLPDEVHAIRLMRDEISRGQKAALAAATVREVLGIGGPAGVFIHRLLEQSEDGDTAAIRATLDLAAKTLGLGECVDDVLLPSMRQIGIWWSVGHCDVTQERTTTESVRTWLDRRSAFAPPPTDTRMILLACGPSDLHTIGLECMAMMLRHDGWPCRVLGARTPTATLVTAATVVDAAAVVVVSQMPTGRRHAVESIDAVHRLRIPVFYAGNSFGTPRSRQHIQGTYLGTRIQGACAQVLAVLRDGGLTAVG